MELLHCKTKYVPSHLNPYKSSQLQSSRKSHLFSFVQYILANNIDQKFILGYQ